MGLSKDAGLPAFDVLETFVNKTKSEGMFTILGGLLMLLFALLGIMYVYSAWLKSEEEKEDMPFFTAFIVIVMSVWLIIGFGVVLSHGFKKVLHPETYAIEKIIDRVHEGTWRY